MRTLLPLFLFFLSIAVSAQQLSQGNLVSNYGWQQVIEKNIVSQLQAQQASSNLADSLHMEKRAIKQATNAIKSLKFGIVFERDITRKIDLQESIINRLEKYQKKFPNSRELRTKLALEYTNLSIYRLANGQLTAAEDAARQGFNLDQENWQIRLGLARTFLFTEKLGQAIAVLKNLEEQKLNDDISYQEMLMRDFEALEEMGIKHNNSKEVRHFLSAGR